MTRPERVVVACPVSSSSLAAARIISLELLCKGIILVLIFTINTVYRNTVRLRGESDESFKKRFTTERSRPFDFLQLEEAAFKIADGCSERSGIFNKSEYQLKPSDGRNLISIIKIFPVICYIYFI